MNEQQNGQDINKPQALYVTLILDESGSMQECTNTARYRRRRQSEQGPVWDDRPSDPSGVPKS